MRVELLRVSCFKLAHQFSLTCRWSVTNNNELGQHNLQLGALSSKCNAWGVELEPSEDRNQANEVAATRTLHVLIVASHSTSLSSRISQRISHASMAAGGYLPAAVPRQRGYIFDIFGGSSTSKVRIANPAHASCPAPARTHAHILTSYTALRAQVITPYLYVITAVAIITCRASTTAQAARTYPPPLPFCTPRDEIATPRVTGWRTHGYTWVPDVAHPRR